MKQTDFSDFQHKLSSETKYLLLVERPAATQVLRILFQTQHTLTEQELRIVENEGCQVQTVAHEIVTGMITVENLPRLAVLALVLQPAP